MPRSIARPGVDLARDAGVLTVARDADAFPNLESFRPTLESRSPPARTLPFAPLTSCTSRA